MIYHFAKLPAAECAVHHNGVPKFFVHVVAGNYFGMAFAQFDGQFRVAFYVEPVALADAGEQEQFFAYFKNKRILAKG